jgi:hypothetical protein
MNLKHNILAFGSRQGQQKWRALKKAHVKKRKSKTGGETPVTTNSGEKTNFGPHFFLFFFGLLYVSFILIIEFLQSNWGPVALVWGSL